LACVGLLPIALALQAVAFPQPTPDRPIVAIDPYQYPDPTALTAQQTADRNHYYPNADAYVRASQSLAGSANELETITYLSDGLRVKAYLYKPRSTGTQQYPVIIFNRDDRQEGDVGFLFAPYFDRLAKYGFIILAPQYRGSAGGEGRDEFGGADVDDIMNLAAVLKQLTFIDSRNVFMYGDGRGGMMAFQAIRNHFPMNAAATIGAFSSLEALFSTDSAMRAARDSIFPLYAQHKDAIDSKRSAIQWPGELRTPILLMHGGADAVVSPLQTLELAAALERLKLPYSLTIYAGDNHAVSRSRLDRDARAISWFHDHMAPSSP
jgi:dipeptidyl aminopeptidase/acylaminoacyl peptidase